MPPANGEAVVIVSCGFTVSLNCWETVAPLLSVIWIVKLAVPVVVGVPLIRPLAEFSVSPAGKAPAVKA